MSLPSQQLVNHESSSLLDRFSARFETILVTVFSLAMTLSISLEIVRDAFRAPDSRLAKFFGIAETANAYALIRDYVSPGLMLVVFFCLGGLPIQPDKNLLALCLLVNARWSQVFCAPFLVSSLQFSSPMYRVFGCAE